MLHRQATAQLSINCINILHRLIMGKMLIGQLYLLFKSYTTLQHLSFKIFQFILPLSILLSGLKWYGDITVIESSNTSQHSSSLLDLSNTHMEPGSCGECVRVCIWWAVGIYVKFLNCCSLSGLRAVTLHMGAEEKEGEGKCFLIRKA